MFFIFYDMETVTINKVYEGISELIKKVNLIEKKMEYIEESIYPPEECFNPEFVKRIEKIKKGKFIRLKNKEEVKEFLNKL